MEDIKKVISTYKFAIIAALLLLICVAYSYFFILPFGWLSFRYFWFKFLLVLILFAFAIGYFLKKEPYFERLVMRIQTLSGRYIKNQKLAAYAVEIILVITLFIIVSIKITVFPYKRLNTAQSTNTPTITVMPQPSGPVDFRDGQNYATIWVGNMGKKDMSDWVMHATYTAEFGYAVLDQTKYVTKVELTNISAKTNLPKYSSLKILPHSSLKRSENGGEILSTNNYEDWNVPFGYIYYEDYLKLPSVGTSYSPELCNSNYSCDQNNQVAKQLGFLGLRFKYLGVASNPDANCPSTRGGFSKCYGISAKDLDTTLSWRMTVTLNDGTSYSKDYSITLKGDTIPVDSNSSSLLMF